MLKPLYECAVLPAKMQLHAVYRSVFPVTDSNLGEGRLK